MSKRKNEIMEHMNLMCTHDIKKQKTDVTEMSQIDFDFILNEYLKLNLHHICANEIQKSVVIKEFEKDLQVVINVSYDIDKTKNVTRDLAAKTLMYNNFDIVNAILELIS